MEKENKIENRLIIPEKETVFVRLCKWVRNMFWTKKAKTWSEEPVVSQWPNITIPKAVKMPVRMEEPEALSENSLEYLYQLSDDELDDLDNLYDEQMEKAKNEIIKLENILQTYKQSIKKLQENLAEDKI